MTPLFYDIFLGACLCILGGGGGCYCVQRPSVAQMTGLCPDSGITRTSMGSKTYIRQENYSDTISSAGSGKQDDEYMHMFQD